MWCVVFFVVVVVDFFFFLILFLTKMQDGVLLESVPEVVTVIIFPIWSHVFGQ